MIKPGEIAYYRRAVIVQCDHCNRPILFVVEPGIPCPASVKHLEPECAGITQVDHVIITFSSDLDFVGRYSLAELLPGGVA